MNKTGQYFGIKFSNLTMMELIQDMVSYVRAGKQGYVVTPNVDHIITLQKDTYFQKVYDDATWVCVDGTPLLWSLKLLGDPVKEKLSGSDLFVQFMPVAEKEGLTLFFLGARAGVADKAKNILEKKYPKLKIVGTYSPPFGFEKDPLENERIITMINQSKASILFVGLGAPKQEKWVHQNFPLLKTINVAAGVGISFDFVAGTVKRAPRILQKTGMEWAYRLSQEPGRLWKRYIIKDTKFIPLFMQTWFNIKRKRRGKGSLHNG